MDKRGPLDSTSPFLSEVVELVSGNVKEDEVNGNTGDVDL